MLNAASVKVEAIGDNNSHAEALAIAIGLAAGAGADAFAEVTSDATVEALVGSMAQLTIPNGPLDVLATGTNIALAYVLHQEFPVFPLVGIRKPSETLSCVAAMEIELSPEEVAWLDLRD